MYNIGQDFPLKCLETLHTILSTPEQLSAAVQKFTQGDEGNARYQCKSILSDIKWTNVEQTAFTAAYFEALYQVLTYFQEDPETDIHLLIAAQHFFVVNYISDILKDPETNKPILFNDVISNINRLIAIEIEASYAMINKDDVNEAPIEGNSHNNHLFFSPETTAKIGIATGAVIIAGMLL